LTRREPEDPAYYFLIVTRLDTGDQRISPEVLLEERLKRGAWPLNRNTAHARKMKPGDRAVFYVARKAQGYAAAQARIASSAWIPTTRELAKLQAPGDEFLGADYYIRLDEISRSPMPVPASELRRSLDLLAGAGSAWGARLQGGAKRLSTHDFELIRVALQGPP